MNKNITNLCIDLQEGKINKKDFLREARRTLPNLITNLNSFSDTIKILKNKNIIAEGCNCEQQINEEDYFLNDEENIKPAAPDGQDLEILRNLDIQDEENELLDDELLDDELLDDELLDDEDNWLEDELEYGDMEDDIPLLESKKKKLTIDQVDPHELKIGIRVEKEHTDDYDKRVKIALDHLSEDPHYYTKLQMAGLDDSKIEKSPKKRTDLPIELDKKFSNVIDKANQMVSPKGYIKDKASSNKAHKETIKPIRGIKTLTHKPIKAKGIKGTMDIEGEKMKIIRKLKEILNRK